MEQQLKSNPYCNHLDCNDEKCCDVYYMKSTGKMTMNGTYVWEKILGEKKFSEQPIRDQEWARSILI